VLRKRIFDTTISILSAPLWIPVLILIGLAILISEGRPIFYTSSRRVYAEDTLRLLKFRTMVRDADKVANRQSMPIVGGVRFLNIGVDSPLYTRVGRLVERCNLTELPQLLHVLKGSMSLVGNRPLPQPVVDSLLEVHPEAERRFRTPGGLCGPVQLVGRTELSDAERLYIESIYCDRVLNNYSVLLDCYIFFSVVMVGLRLKSPISVQAIERILRDDAGLATESSLGLGWPVEAEAEAEAR
jgi:lipopolysaccharide/colanic/teichoic acid biosynthesis glycosyltransferase